MKVLPASLFGRVMLILFVGLAAAQLLSFALVLLERGMASRGMMVNYLASDVASSVAMLERLPPADAARLRTAALCLARAQRVHRATLPAEATREIVSHVLEE